MRVKDNWEMPNDIPNMAEIPILNHRDDGENSMMKRKNDTIKYFSFRTLYELKYRKGFDDCDVAIAEDFFWTATPFMRDGKLTDYDFTNSCVVASGWGTPCIIVDDKAWACYEEVPRDEFPGVYLSDWEPEFLEAEMDKVREFFVDTLESIIQKRMF